LRGAGEHIDDALFDAAVREVFDSRQGRHERKRPIAADADILTYVLA
jgi:hypothetical protein